MDEMKLVLTSPNVVCPKCGSKLFQEVVALKRISSIMSPTGQEEIVPVPMYACISCGEIPDEYKKKRNYDVIMGNKTDDTMPEPKVEEPKPTIIMP